VWEKRDEIKRCARKVNISLRSLISGNDFQHRHTKRITALRACWRHRLARDQEDVHLRKVQEWDTGSPEKRAAGLG
jgi:hypothetical protein